MKYFLIALSILFCGCSNYIKVAKCQEYINLNNKAWEEVYCTNIIKSQLELTKAKKLGYVSFPKKCVPYFEKVKD